MSAPLPARVGWCPGALRPMETGDGYVVRVKPSGGVLALDTASALAELAVTFGNGEIDLTARANLQIRGARAETLDPLAQALAELDLLDRDAGTEAIRNIVASPLSGYDWTMPANIRPHIRVLEQRLATDAALQALPAKWSFVVDGGGALTLSGVPADIRFEACVDGTWRVGLGPDPARATFHGNTLPDVAAALCRLALTATPMRMADLLRTRSANELFAAAGLLPATPRPERPPTSPRDVVGCHTVDGGCYLGIGVAFGGLTADALRTIARESRAIGAHDLRLTPWRALLVTGLHSDRADRLRDTLSPTRLILDPNDPRLAIAACSGAPACYRATTPVRAHAEGLAALGFPAATPNSLAIHVSGCAKGCAHPHPAGWTLVGHDGAYDLVRDGKAGDTPIARGLSFQEAAGWVSRSPGEGRL